MSFKVFPFSTSVRYFLILTSSPCLSCLPLSITPHSASDFLPSCEYYEYITDSSEAGAALFLPLAFKGVSAFWPMSSPLSSHPCSFEFQKAQTVDRSLGFSCLLYFSSDTQLNSCCLGLKWVNLSLRFLLFWQLHYNSQQ